jgi:succinoglycan biosynthesis protein ExoV
VILYHWRGASSNFGDELNTILWPRLLPDFFDSNPAVRFLGIGSVLDQRHPAQPVKLVAGSGYGGYERKPRLSENWIIHWVRGPRTAATLGLPPALGLGDPAILVPGAVGLPAANGDDIGYMPHFESAARGAWRQAADRAGVRLIDPRDKPDDILRAIGRCKLLMSEALHGVIVADAMRVPWIPIRPLVRDHRPKWRDWADTMDLRPRFRALTASTPSEWAGTIRQGWLDQSLAGWTLEPLVARAAEALRQAASTPPHLSAETALDRCQSRMLEAVHAIRRAPLRPSPAARRIASPLQTVDDSAYQLAPNG